MSLSAVYQSDKRVAETTSRMTEVGIGFDKAKAAEFQHLLREKEAAALVEAELALGRTLRRTKSGGVSSDDLAKAFFEDLGVPILFLSTLTGKPSLSALALEHYAASRNDRLKALAKAESARRRAVKVRATYIEGVKLGRDGRVHPGWKNYGTISGRWACSNPNLANLPRKSNDPLKDHGGIRSLYIPREGYRFVYFDKSQIEYRIAAYASGDDAMIEACEAGDVHSANASILFPSFDKAVYKRLKDSASTEQEKALFTALDNLRTLAKSSVFAVCYLAEAPTVYERIVASGVPVKLAQVQAMLNALRSRCRIYYQWQAKRLLECVKNGYTTTPILGRRRHLGHEPSPSECANFPIQGGAADVMSEELPRVARAVRAEADETAELVAHVYDSVLIECKEEKAQAVAEVCRFESLKPVTISSSGADRVMVLPIDLEILKRWK